MHPSDVPSVDLDAIPADAVLLDVREDDEWTAGHIAGAIHVPMNELPPALQRDADLLAPDASIVVVCKVGSRSAYVTAWLRQQGYDAVNLTGGMLAWEHARRPMTAEHGQSPYVA